MKNEGYRQQGIHIFHVVNLDDKTIFGTKIVYKYTHIFRHGKFFVCNHIIMVSVYKHLSVRYSEYSQRHILLFQISFSLTKTNFLSCCIHVFSASLHHTLPADYLHELNKIPKIVVFYYLQQPCISASLCLFFHSLSFS